MTARVRDGTLRATNDSSSELFRALQKVQVKNQ